SLASAVASLATTTPTAALGAVATATAPGASTPASAGDPASLVGEWQIVAGGDSFVGYRVVEELANFGTNTAVGRTSNVTGTLSYDGSTITVVQIEADLSTLRSDDSRRDNALGRQSLETRTFRTATFTLTQPITLDSEPIADTPNEATAQGQLTLHGVTRDVTLSLSGTLTAGRVVVVGSLDIVFADYAIAPPSARLILSVEDHGVLEFQLVFERAS
ncbi:MAG: YceI family protein, partial [Chloroflexi bacterium]|nr:YceI family protein [Chloroflexota bacterium]